MMRTYPIAGIRSKFPSLAIEDAGVPRAYLDNPAGTQVPQAVAEAAARCLIETNANLGGDFVTSVAAERIASRAHVAMSRFLGARSPREVVIGPSMTALTFTFSRSLGRTLSAGDEIVVTRMDHEGNVSPWLILAEERGLTIRWVDFDRETWQIERGALEAALGPKTRIVALNYANNLTGSINDVRPLIDLSHTAGALVYLDAVQYAPHRAMDVSALHADFVVCSSYKFFGPHMAMLWANGNTLNELFAYKVRPQTDAPPYRFETGTPQIEQLAAIEATVAYFESIGARFTASTDPRARIEAAFEAFETWETDLAARLIEGLMRIGGVRVIGIADPRRYRWRVPTVSFIRQGFRSADIAKHLAQRNVFVWSGHNYALETLRALGLDEDDGVVRVGFAHYNTPEEVDRVLASLAEM